MNIKEILTLSLAIYGALLSTGLLVRTLLKDRKRIHVRTKFAYDSNGGRHISVQASNAGTRPITVDRPYLRTRDGRKLVVMGRDVTNTNYPTTLTEGQSVTALLDLDYVEDAIVKENIGRKLRGAVDDQLGRTYKAKKSIEI